MQGSLEEVVALYRASSERSYQDNKIFGSLPFKTGIQLLLDAIASERGRLQSLHIDGATIDTDFIQEELPKTGTTITYSFRPHSSSLSRFYSSIDELISTGTSISRGESPADYYLVAEDCYSEEEPKHQIASAIENACCAIKLLAKVAHYHDSKNNTDCFRLLFVHSNIEKQTRPLVVHTALNSEIVKHCQNINLETLQALASAKPSDDPHFATKQGVFYSTISDFLANTEDESNYFSSLIKNWNQFNESYQKNLNTYFSGFAFHKAKKEVAKTQLDLASELSKVVGDITGKMLAIPLSFAALIALSNAKSLLDQAILVIGLVFASVIVSEILQNQKRHFSRITHSKNIALNAIDGNATEYPAELNADIEKMKANLATDEKRLGRSLALLRVASWCPPIAAIGLLLALHHDRFLYNAEYIYSLAVSACQAVIDSTDFSYAFHTKDKACLLFSPFTP